MDIKVFNRIEKKYLIDASQKRAMLTAIAEKMERDNYHKSTIFNIYFDTKNDDLIIQSIEKPIFKEKLRARSYDGYDKVFFEIKTKIRENKTNIGYKRRVLITAKDYDEFIAHKKKIVQLAKREIEKGTDVQIAKEIDYLVDHFKLVPKVLVIYDRESYKGENSFRLTFDENLRYRTDNLTFKKGPHDQKYFSDNKDIIMEVKAQEAMPLWFVKAMSANKIYPQPFSKVGRIYQKVKGEQNV